MIRLALAAALAGAASPALAASPAFTAPQAAGGSAVARALQDGYEIKAAFSDNNGGAYMVLQKGTSAFFCHSNPTPTCEKLN